MFHPDKLRARFHELAAERARVVAAAAPARAEYDALRKEEQAIAERQKPVIERMKEIEAPLHDIGMEMAAIARALNGKTGPLQV
jgi:chromosome segregation ATPase